MATTVATVIGFMKAAAILRRVKSAVQRWRGGKTAIDLDAVRRELS